MDKCLIAPELEPELVFFYSGSPALVYRGGQYRVQKYRGTFLVPVPVPRYFFIKYRGTPSNIRGIESFFCKHCDMFLFFVSIAASK